MNERRHINLDEGGDFEVDNRDIYTTEIHLKDGTIITIDIPFALWLVQNAYENSR